VEVLLLADDNLVAQQSLRMIQVRCR